MFDESPTGASIEKSKKDSRLIVIRDKDLGFGTGLVDSEGVFDMKYLLDSDLIDLLIRVGVRRGTSSTSRAARARSSRRLRSRGGWLDHRGMWRHRDLVVLITLRPVVLTAVVATTTTTLIVSVGLVLGALSSDYFAFVGSMAAITMNLTVFLTARGVALTIV